jgi:hypothetical protein
LRSSRLDVVGYQLRGSERQVCPAQTTQPPGEGDNGSQETRRP